MSKIAFIKGFYEQLYAFLGEMTEMYPEDIEFRTYDTSLRMIQTTNPVLAPKTFYETVRDFSDKIDARDEAFFLNYTYKDVDVDIVGKMSKYFIESSPETKKCVWDYVTVLKELSKRAVS